MSRQRCKLLGLASPPGKLHGLLQALADLVGHHARHPTLEERRGYRNYADTVPGQVPRHGQRHGRHRALGGRVRDLALLAVEGGGRGDHDDDAALPVRLAGLGLGYVR